MEDRTRHAVAAAVLTLGSLSLVGAAFMSAPARGDGRQRLAVVRDASPTPVETTAPSTTTAPTSTSTTSTTAAPPSTTTSTAQPTSTTTSSTIASLPPSTTSTTAEPTTTSTTSTSVAGIDLSQRRYGTGPDSAAGYRDPLGYCTIADVNGHHDWLVPDDSCMDPETHMVPASQWGQRKTATP